MKEIIAANILHYRKSVGLSQEQLAEQASVTRQSINNYENAKTLPDSKILSALSRVLGVTLDDLLRPPSEGLLNFRFRAHGSFDKNPQFAAQVLRILQTYHALEQAVGLPTYTPDVVKLKRHFRVSYLVILNRLAAMGIIEFAKEKAKICAIYQKQHHGESLQNSMELPPAIGIEEYPENERYECLIWQCLKMGKISEIKAAELLNLTVEKLRVRRQENQVYAIA